MIFNKMIIIFLSLYLIKYVKTHGTVLDPVGRASRWRFNNSAPLNSNDFELFCGGITQQWQTNGGKCGLCGDNYSQLKPRNHELGGIFGEGIIVKNYLSESIIQVNILLTANHMGYFTFDLCNLNLFQENEDCFKMYQLKLLDGSSKFQLTSQETGMYYIKLQLPEKLNCTHCVLRWNYYTANNWGQCNNKTEALGCGPQENYKSCSDIRILNNFQ